MMARLVPFSVLYIFSRIVLPGFLLPPPGQPVDNLLTLLLARDLLDLP